MLADVIGSIDLDLPRAAPHFRAVEHRICDSGMRLDSNPEIRLDEHWKAVLSGSDLRVFDEVAGRADRGHRWMQGPTGD